MSFPKQKYSDWIPGVLSRRQIRQLIADGLIDSPSSDPKSFDHSSFDLHMTGEVYKMADGSVKPSGGRYLYLAKQESTVEKLMPDSRGEFLLERLNTFVVKVAERLLLKDFIENVGDVYGQATAKSSVGRVDVLARLIVDGARDYESFRSEDVKKGSGEMYVEITPITFNVKIKPGQAVNQLRLFLGKPEEAEIASEVLHRQVLRNSEGSPDGSLSVDLEDATIRGVSGSALAATDRIEQAICLWDGDGAEKPNPCQFWKLLRANQHERLRIEKENFYILRSKERIALPKGVAVYCRASDETIGEMRIHYAGFVHPFFGYGRNDGRVGTPLIFEVRGHNLNVSLVDRERMANLTFYRMSEDAEEDPPTDDKKYNEQELKLSAYFGDWPLQLTRLDDGTLIPGS
ncbi:MAG: dCTP deaminase [Thermoanaerobaculia bacterium]|jgi:dCTP deaminase|nr:dCTP deaminase [Thermoanaerobaculia bacterium]